MYIAVHISITDPIGITVSFTQLTFTAYEGDLVQVCVTMSSGELGTDVLFSIDSEAEVGSHNSGLNNIICIVGSCL